jgi:ketosteroid isomerase-like protein
MKLLSGLVAVLLIMSASEEIPSAEKTVSDLENQWAEAQKTGNADVVAPMLADTFTNTDADGETYGKSQLLSNLKGGKWEVNGISDVKVKVYGKAAVATGSWTGKGVDGDGTHMDRSERWTDTWVKTPRGNWQCVASQQTTSKK